MRQFTHTDLIIKTEQNYEKLEPITLSKIDKPEFSMPYQIGQYLKAYEDYFFQNDELLHATMGNTQHDGKNYHFGSALLPESLYMNSELYKAPMGNTRNKYANMVIVQNKTIKEGERFNTIGFLRRGDQLVMYEVAATGEKLSDNSTSVIPRAKPQKELTTFKLPRQFIDKIPEGANPDVLYTSSNTPKLLRPFENVDSRGVQNIDNADYYSIFRNAIDAGIKRIKNDAYSYNNKIEQVKIAIAANLDTPSPNGLFIIK